jgi:low-affinity ferrous iron transport protein
LIEVLASPGAKAQVAAGAPTQKVTAGDETDVDTVAALGPDDVEKAIAVAEVEKDVAFHTEAKHRRLDRWLDAVVKASGSQLVFFVVLAGLLAWMFLGIKFYDDINWQVVILSEVDRSQSQRSGITVEDTGGV